MIVSKLILIFFSSFLITLFFVLLFRPLAKKKGFVDKPTERKTHFGNIPLIGGICIFIGVFTSTILEIRDNHIFTAIIASSFFMLLLGFIDDCNPLPAIFKIGVQFIIVSLMVWYTGLKFETFGHSFGLPNQISLGILSYPLTILGIVFVTNAFNLMDGADGVAGSLAIVAIFGINIVQALFGNFKLDIVSIALAGSLTIFIWFNLQKSSNDKIFLGDSGSLFLGYIIACLLLYQTKSNNNISPTMAFWIIAIPIFDVLTVIIYRLRKSHYLFAPDKSHLHYFLQELGFSNVTILFFIIFLAMFILSSGILIENCTRFLSFPSFVFFLLTYVWLRVYTRLSKFNA